MNNRELFNPPPQADQEGAPKCSKCGSERSRSALELEDFVHFCRMNPDLRFWQSLANWAGYDRILAVNDADVHDTYYWERRNGNKD